MNLKRHPPSPPSFLFSIKVLGSRWVIGVDFAITAKFSPKKIGSPTINKIIYLGQIKITQKDNKK